MATTELLERPVAQTKASVPRPRQAESAQHKPNRDRFLDILRVGAVLVVVAEHWLMPVLDYDNGELKTGNALTAPGAWAITWLSQVMPLIFFAGGAAAALSLRGRRRRGERATYWVSDRLTRLAWPVLTLAAVWVPLPHILDLLGVPSQPLHMGSRVVGQLLWFLAVYVLVTALSPVLTRWHEKWRGAEIAVIASGAIVVDVLRFGPFDGTDVIGYANVVLVWAAIYQIGIAYGHGRLNALHGARAWTVAAAGFGATALAIAAGPYPLSMIGMPGAPLSNVNPPTAVLITLAVGQVGLALAVKPHLERWASRGEVAQSLDRVSQRLMSIYLWHMPVLVAMAGVAVMGLGYETAEPFSQQWLREMPFWITALALVLGVVVGAVGRFEHPSSSLASGTTTRAITPTAAALIGGGLLAFTINGFVPENSVALIAGVSVAVGIALLQVHRLPGSLINPITRKA